MTEQTYKQKPELVAITLTDSGDTRKWHKGDVVTLRWSHAGREGIGDFKVVRAERDRHSAIVAIDLEPVSPEQDT